MAPEKGCQKPLLLAWSKQKSVTNTRFFGLDSGRLRHLCGQWKSAESGASFQGLAWISTSFASAFSDKKWHKKPRCNVGYLQEACLTKLTNGIAFFQNITTCKDG
jgi:hypothetical protein